MLLAARSMTTVVVVAVRGGERSYQLVIQRGLLVLQIVKTIPEPGSASWHMVVERNWGGGTIEGPESAWEYFGLLSTMKRVPGETVVDNAGRSYPTTIYAPTRTAAVPLWLIAALLGLGLARRARRSWRATIVLRRRLNGLCGECGYDVRETKERCPECGSQVVPTRLAGVPEAAGKS